AVVTHQRKSNIVQFIFGIIGIFKDFNSVNQDLPVQIPVGIVFRRNGCGVVHLIRVISGFCKNLFVGIAEVVIQGVVFGIPVGIEMTGNPESFRFMFHSAIHQELGITAVGI